MKIKSKYIDENGMEYKSRRSKSSKVKVYFDPSRIEKKNLGFFQEDSGYRFESENVKVTFSFVKNELRVFSKIASFSKSFAIGKGTESLKVNTLEKISFETFEQLSAVFA